MLDNIKLEISEENIDDTKSLVRTFIESMKNSLKPTSIVRISLVKEVLFTYSELKDLFDGQFIVSWYIDDSIEHDQESVSELSVKKLVPISLIISCDDKHSLFVQGKVVNGFIDEKNSAITISNIAKSLFRLSN